MRDAVRATLGDWESARDALRLHIPPEATFVRHVRNRIMDFARAHDVGGDDLTDFLTALGEAIANSVEHGHCRDTIEVACWMLDDQQIFATVVDYGVGFETLGAVPGESELPDPLAVRGRGFALMRRCTDVFAVRSAPGAGTAVMLGRTLRR